MITLLLLIFPILAGLLFLILNKGGSGVLSKIAGAFAVAEAGLALYALKLFKSNSDLLDFNAKWVADLSINFHIGWDGLTAVMLLLTVSVVGLVIFSVSGINYKNKNKLYALLFFTQAALIGVFSAKDIFVFYFFFEIALIPVYLIANFWGGANSSKITFRMLVYTIFGSLLMLVGFVMLYMRAQTSDIDSILSTVSLLPSSLQSFVFWAFLIAFAIKMPIFPLHSWLPDAYSTSPTPASMLLSGVLSKMGVFGLIKILIPFAPQGISQFSHLVIILSVVGLIYGSIIAIQQDSLKRLIAYSSFAHLGIMAGAVLTLNPEGIQGAIFQMLAHGLNVVGLFFIAKIIFERTGERTLSSLGGIAQKAPVFSVIFMVVLLGAVALPLTNGFVGEFLMLKALFDYNSWIGGIAGLSIILGAVYMLRLFQKSIFGEMNKSVENFKDLTLNELIVLIPIVLVIIITGVFPNCVLEISEPYVNGLKLILN
jgi:NADH-quinone oxidoreductase subunit M